MNKLNIDFKGLLPYIVEAFTAVYGEEYRTIISQKVNKTLIISYHDVEGMEGYVRYLERCKKREYGIKFLEKIGIKVKYEKDNFTRPLPDGAQNILQHMIGGLTFGFSKNADDFSPLRAFDSNNRRTSEYLLENKIKLINYLLGDSEEVTKDNFDDFIKTDDYSKLLEAINGYRKIYEELLKEYTTWTKNLLPYEKYIKQENERKNFILEQKKKELFEEIFDKLPLALKNALLNKKTEEQMNIIFGLGSIGKKSRLEYFQKENIEQLKSDDFILLLMPIIWKHTDYFKDLGITIPDEFLHCDSKEDINKYLEFFNQDNIKQYIPSEDVIKDITSLREMKYEEALREYYTTREDFINTMKIFNKNNMEYLYRTFKNKVVCIVGNGCVNDKGEFMPLMFYTVKDGGCLLFSFVHENGHIIDQNEKGCGFELAIDFSLEGRRNPYDKAYRKYEKFNETLNDIFTLEAIKFLQDQGIYLMEAKEITKLDGENFNTALITKSLLKPLVQNFREQVIKAKVNACPEELIKYIGEDNFKNLVDAVNKVDYLSRNGVIPKIEKVTKDDMVVEYLEQVDRVKQIYNDIDEYYNEHFGELMGVNKAKIMLYL